MIRDMVREFARQRDRPDRATRSTRTTASPRRPGTKIVELGLPGIPFPEESAVPDGGTLAYIIASRRSAGVCGSTGLTLAAHVSLGTYPIYAWGGDKLKEFTCPS